MSLLTANLDWIKLARTARFQRREFAKLCSVSPGRLSTFFVEHFKRPPQDWLDELRMWDGFQALCEGVPLKTVAFNLGFKQPSHFSRMFTQYHGICPSKCRASFLARERRRQNFLDRISPEADLPDSWRLCPIWIEAHQVLAPREWRKPVNSAERYERVLMDTSCAFQRFQTFCNLHAIQKEDHAQMLEVNPREGIPEFPP
jgi:AraC-like DNA-binding protein